MDNSVFLTICGDNYRAVFSILRETLSLCPDDLWDDPLNSGGFPQPGRAAFLAAALPPQFGGYHSLWWFDFYISSSPQSFQGPAFAGERDHEMGDPPGPAPSRKQMADYLETVSQKCTAALAGLADARLDGENNFPWTGATLAHRLVYNLRHARPSGRTKGATPRRRAERPADLRQERRWVI